QRPDLLGIQLVAGHGDPDVGLLVAGQRAGHGPGKRPRRVVDRDDDVDVGHASPASCAWVANSGSTATTSSKVPRATIVPSRMKQTWSLCRTVDSRCATAMTVTSPCSSRIA